MMAAARTIKHRYLLSYIFLVTVSDMWFFYVAMGHQTAFFRLYSLASSLATAFDAARFFDWCGCYFVGVLLQQIGINNNNILFDEKTFTLSQ